MNDLEQWKQDLENYYRNLFFMDPKHKNDWQEAARQAAESQYQAELLKRQTSVNLPEVTVTASNPTKTVATESDWDPGYTKFMSGEQYYADQGHKNYLDLQRNDYTRGIREATDKWGKGIGLGMAAAAAIPVASGAVAGMNAIRAAHPIAAGLWDAYWAGDGIVRNILGDSGVKKTYRLAKEGDAWGAVKSGAGDALDLLGFTDVWQLGKKIANPLYRAGHAYVNISPAGYDNPVLKAINYTLDLLTGKPADLSHPKWDGQVDPRRTANYIVGHGLPGEMEDLAQVIATMTRDDAWRKYLGLPEKHGMYIRNADGTYSYNLQKINAISDGKLMPDLSHTSGEIEIPFADNDWPGYDFVTGAGGGLTGNTSKLVRIDPDGTKHGIQTITDRWDLHPFSRPGDKIIEKVWGRTIQPATSKVVSKLHSVGNAIGYDIKSFEKALASAPEFERELIELDMFPRQNKILRKIGDKLQNINYLQMPAFLKKLDDKIASYEVGPILGGRPFDMKTDIPIKVILEVPTSLSLSPIQKLQLQQTMKDFEYTGTMDDYLKELGPETKVKLDLKSGGTIHIKKKNKGKFTASAKAAGEGVQEHAHKVMNDPNATPLQKKRANFAIQAKKWHRKHQLGGKINYLNYFQHE